MGIARRVFLLTLASIAAARIPPWSASVSDVVYAETNRTAANFILLFNQAGSGSPTFLASTPVGGIGVFDATFGLGAFDSDQNLTVKPARTLLFAVNSGSNSTAVFRIHPDGSLEAIAGSPFASGGGEPVRVGTILCFAD